MDPVTPPRVVKRSSHRRTKSTPDCGSVGGSGDETCLTSPISPLDCCTVRGGVTIPATPVSPPSVINGSDNGRFNSSAVGSPDALNEPIIYDFQIFLEDPREMSTPQEPANSGNEDSISESLRLKVNKKRDQRKLKRASLLPAHSDPSALHSMVGGLEISINNDFISSNHGDDVFASSSRPGSMGSSFATASSVERPSTPDKAFAISFSPPPVDGDHKSSSNPEGSATSDDDITAENAQARLSPDACIFVANLPKDKTDAEIFEALTREFEKYGTCYIKIKRDRSMPIAFVQYRDPQVAVTVLEHAPGTLILTRKCRVERAKAPRCLYVYRRDGKLPSEKEVLKLLAKSGELDKVWAPTETELEKYGLAPGFCVRFKFYQDSVEAIMVHRGDEMYHVESFHAPDKMNHAVFATDSYLMEPNPSCSVPNYNAGIHLNSALWVGELPPSITKAELARVFGGQKRLITHIDLRIRWSRGAKFESYAIVRFLDPYSAVEAARVTHRKLRLITGHSVRIEFAYKSFSPGFKGFRGNHSSSGNVNSHPGYVGPPSFYDAHNQMGAPGPYNHGSLRSYSQGSYGMSNGGMDSTSMHSYQGNIDCMNFYTNGQASGAHTQAQLSSNRCSGGTLHPVFSTLQGHSASSSQAQTGGGFTLMNHPVQYISPTSSVAQANNTFPVVNGTAAQVNGTYSAVNGTLNGVAAQMNGNYPLNNNNGSQMNGNYPANNTGAQLNGAYPANTFQTSPRFFARP
ncbi:hypothetical protein SLS56_004240 [Neofusicoccum ribis]|uniref:RRM domain-containing protein n=1 Tax=Neofusicoccum ribis TaxID=45134 RepID=A0ABR3SXV8_9PEZI